MGNIPQEMKKLQQEINKSFETYQVLDSYSYKFMKEELDQKWNLFGSPREIEKLIENRSLELEKDKKRFGEEMKNEQLEFKERMDNLEMTINNFHTFCDLA